MRTALFLAPRQGVVVIPYRSFGTTYWSLLHWPLKMGPIGCPETSIRNYRCALRNTKISQFCPYQGVLYFKNVILFGGTLINGILFALLWEVRALLLPIAYIFTCCHLQNKHKAYTTLMSTGDTLYRVRQEDVTVFSLLFCWIGLNCGILVAKCR